jgi:hypothetical protein
VPLGLLFAVQLNPLLNLNTATLLPSLTNSVQRSAPQKHSNPITIRIVIARSVPWRLRFRVLARPRTQGPGGPLVCILQRHRCLALLLGWLAVSSYVKLTFFRLAEHLFKPHFKTLNCCQGKIRRSMTSLSQMVPIPRHDR